MKIIETLIIFFSISSFFYNIFSNFNIVYIFSLDLVVYLIYSTRDYFKIYFK